MVVPEVYQNMFKLDSKWYNWWIYFARKDAKYKRLILEEIPGA